MKYLNTNAKFKCSNFVIPTATLKAISMGNVKINGQVVLTEATKLANMGPNMCRMQQPQPGVYLPCILTNQGPWTQTSIKVKYKGKSMLTEASCTNCMSFGGKITVDKTTTVGIKVVVSKGIDNSFTNAASSTGAVESSSQKLIKQASPSGKFETKEKAVGADKADTSLRQDAALKINEAKNSFCPMCDKANTCGYHMADSNVDNDSGKLRRNMKAAGMLEDSLLESNDYGIAAHHIISGNNVFRRHTELVKLANFYGYDINNAQNGIYLPMNPSTRGTENPKFSEQTTVYKVKTAYEVMDLTGKQWHVAGHDYRLGKAYLKSCEHELKNYVQALNEQLIIVETKLYERKQCRYNPKAKEQFFALMHEVEKTVRKKLDAFKENPRKSKPFYVSEVALSYAFGLPETMKFIALERLENGTYAQQYRLERKKGIIVFNLTKEMNYSPENPKEVIEFIKWSGNVRHFIMCSEGEPKEILPFTEENVIYMPKAIPDTMSHLYSNKNTIYAFLRESQVTYNSPIQVIKKRLGEVN